MVIRRDCQDGFLGRMGVRVRGNAGNRAAVGTDRRVRDTILLIVLVASPSVGIVLLGLAK